jgi:hypothetical protein
MTWIITGARRASSTRRDCVKGVREESVATSSAGREIRTPLSPIGVDFDDESVGGGAASYAA